VRRIRIYELARELKLEPRRVIEEARRLGLNVSVPSDQLTEEQAEQIRSRHLAKWYFANWPSGTLPRRRMRLTRSEDALELTFDLACGSSSHPVSMTLTWWGAVTMSSPCLLLPESARRLAQSTCPKALDEVKRFVQQVLYVWKGDLPCLRFLTDKIANQVMSFFARPRGGVKERAKAILEEWECTDDCGAGG